MSRSLRYLAMAGAFALALFVPVLGFCTVESTLTSIQAEFINVILPLVGIIGLVFSGLSFVMGSPNARSHLILALIGAGVGFGAPSIIAFIHGLVN